MDSDEFILTLHPDPARKGVRIERVKYDAIRASILDLLRARGPQTFSNLGALIEEKLDGTFDGSVMWYYTTVKLDLEARGELRRVSNSKPQMIEPCMQ